MRAAHVFIRTEGGVFVFLARVILQFHRSRILEHRTDRKTVFLRDLDEGIGGHRGTDIPVAFARQRGQTRERIAHAAADRVQGRGGAVRKFLQGFRQNFPHKTSFYQKFFISFTLKVYQIRK